VAIYLLLPSICAFCHVVDVSDCCLPLSAALQLLVFVLKADMEKITRVDIRIIARFALNCFLTVSFACCVLFACCMLFLFVISCCTLCVLYLLIFYRQNLTEFLLLCDNVDLESAEELYQRRITRILTSDFPKYFAVVTRVRHDTALLGPDGGLMSSRVNPQVQAVFPPTALTKPIKVGLQVRTTNTTNRLWHCFVLSVCYRPGAIYLWWWWWCIFHCHL